MNPIMIDEIKKKIKQWRSQPGSTFRTCDTGYEVGS
jgi:hypothetical protein